jgi:sec-independent protein translocase protein TatC
MAKNYIILNHIEEFKYRFFYILLTLVISFITFYIFIGELTYVVIKPLFLNNNYEIQELIYTDMSEAFLASIKLTLFFACYSCIPIIIYHLYYFFLPGLYIHEQKSILQFIIISICLMVTSFTFAYLFFVPIVWDFFLNYDLNIDKNLFKVSFQGKIIEYINLITSILFSFVICFQLPLFFMVLLKTELISYKELQKYRPLNIILCFFCGAIFSPPDVFSQICIAIPLCFVYEINILFSLFLNNKKCCLEI